MVSTRIYLLFILLMSIMPAEIIGYAGTLTASECKAYFASDDINKNLEALFSCPKKWRPKPKRRQTRLEKHALFTPTNNNNNNNDDD